MTSQSHRLPLENGDGHTSTRRYDLAIIGKGMIGSAAARHAAKISIRSGLELRIALIGPSEPTDDIASTMTTVFGAHYDEGRITRRTDPDPIWAELASRSIARYDEIHREANNTYPSSSSSSSSSDRGNRENHFYCECGHLAVGLPNSDMINTRTQNANELGVEYASLDEDALKETFPYLNFPKGSVGLHESKDSGYISARGLVAAQVAAAESIGVRVADRIVHRVEKKYCTADTSSSGSSEGAHDECYFRIEVGTEHGTTTLTTTTETIEANKVLVAAGAFCNARPLLPKKLDLSPRRTQTVHFLLSEEDASRLCCGATATNGSNNNNTPMPSIIVKNDRFWAYALPPIRYPDGTIRLKLGGKYLYAEEDECGQHQHQQLQTDREVIDWYRSNGNADDTKAMGGMLRSLVPNAEPTSILSNSCTTLMTSTGQVYVGEVDDGWAVATGGNGLAAKSSDEIGRLGALCVLDKIAFESESICGRSCAEVFRPRYKH